MQFFVIKKQNKYIAYCCICTCSLVLPASSAASAYTAAGAAAAAAAAAGAAAAASALLLVGPARRFLSFQLSCERYMMDVVQNSKKNSGYEY